MEYKKVKLNDIVSILGDGIHGTPKYSENGEYYFINGNNLSEGKIIIKQDTKRVSLEEYEKYKKELNNRTLLVSINGTLGNVAVYNNEKCILGKSACYFNVRENVNKQFIKYILYSNEFQKYIQEYATGTTIKNMSLKAMREYEFKLPEIDIQNKIANILSNIDKKIELNNKINDNLFEVLKQYITEHYYINNDIQNSTINKIGKIQGGYAFKSKDLLDEVTNNKIFKIKNISSSGVDIDNTQCVYDEVADKVDKKFLLTRGDVIIAMTGAELGKTGYLFGKENSYFLNQRVGVVRGNDIFSSLYLNCVFLLEKMQNTLNSKGYGSAQPNISTSDIENIEIPIPDEIELKKFYEIANPIYNKMILNSEQNQYLTKLRDALLPKLMNGEIDLDNIEI